MTFYRRTSILRVILSRKIFPDCKYAALFLRLAAGIADNRFHDKTTNHDSRRCGLPGDWVLSRSLAASVRIPPLYPDPVLDLFGFSLS